MTKAIVVGGGIVGLTTSIGLLKQGFRVHLVDPSLHRSVAASWGNAGHIAVEQVAPFASQRALVQAARRLLSADGGVSLPPRAVATWLPFSLRLLRAAQPRRFESGRAALKSLLQHAAPAWQRFAQALGAPELLRLDGHYVTWSSEGQADTGRRQWLNDDIGCAGVRDASADELRSLNALAPGKIAAALRFSGTGQVLDPDVLRRIICDQFTTGGGAFVDGTASALSSTGNQAAVRLEDGRLLTGDAIVVAAGVGTQPLLSGFGYRVPMIAERGYHLTYDCERWPADTPPVVFEDRAVIVTRFASCVRVCGFVEFCKPDTTVDARKWQRLARTTEELCLTVGKRLGQWCGSRPTLPDYLPAVGKSRRAANLYYAFGHQHLGLTLAPITAEIVVALVSGAAPEIGLTPFDLERFS